MSASRRPLDRRADLCGKVTRELPGLDLHDRVADRAESPEHADLAAISHERAARGGGREIERVLDLDLARDLPVLAPRERHQMARTLRLDDLDLEIDRKSTRLNSSHSQISYAVFCLKKK